MSSKYSIKIAGVKFEFPIMNASGIYGNKPEDGLEMQNLGSGGWVTKSIGFLPSKGNKGRTIAKLPHNMLLNTVGLKNKGYETFLNKLGEYREEIKIPIIMSIFDGSSEKCGIMAEKIKDSELINIIELNLSCTNDEEIKVIGEHPDLTEEWVSAVYNIVRDKMPIAIKLAPQVKKEEAKKLHRDLEEYVKPIYNEYNLFEVASVAIDSGAKILVATNTVNGKVNKHKIKNFCCNFGGISGQGIKPISLRNVEFLSENFGDEVDIVGVGGISNTQDVLDYLDVGAKAVQIGTAAMKNSKIFKEIKEILT